jgi:hypothetical protein
MEIANLIVSVATLALVIYTLTRVNALFRELRTPIVKKFSPELNLRRDSRKPVSPQDLAGRSSSSGKDSGEGRNKQRGERSERPQRGDKPQGAGRGERAPRQDRSGRFNKPQGAVSNEAAPLLSDTVAGAAPSVSLAAAAPSHAVSSHAAPSEGRRPLTPRAPGQAAPAPVMHSAPEAAPAAPVAVAAPAGDGEEAPISFDRSKMNFGRRNQVKKEVVPEGAEGEGQAAA